MRILKKYFDLKCLTLIFCVLLTDSVLAGVYRCFDENGVMEFRDRGCELASEENDFLPYTYTPTDPKSVFEGKEVLHKTEKITEKQRLEAQKKTRLAARQKKAGEKAAAKIERRLMRCEKTREKIKQIEADLRAGAKIRRSKTLKKQQIHAQKMEKNYCTQP